MIRVDQTLRNKSIMPTYIGAISYFVYINLKIGLWDSIEQEIFHPLEREIKSNAIL